MLLASFINRGVPFLRRNGTCLIVLCDAQGYNKHAMGLINAFDIKYLSKLTETHNFTFYCNASCYQKLTD